MKTFKYRKCSCDSPVCRTHRASECSTIANHFHVEFLGTEDSLCDKCFERHTVRVATAARLIASRRHVFTFVPARFRECRAAI